MSLLRLGCFDNLFFSVLLYRNFVHRNFIVIKIKYRDIRYL